MKIILFFFLCSTQLFSIELEEQPTICLNMIVKDESAVIKRCLDSVMPIIDYWVIVDTGSTDKTQEIIKEHLKDIPGELYERPWRNFGDNRTEAFELAKGKGDYILFMDADDVLEFAPDFEFPPLAKDQYTMWRGTPGFSYLKPQLVKGDLPWKWIGVTHEYLGCNQHYDSETLENIRYVSKDGGARSLSNEKFFRNVQLLKEGLKKEPDNERYMFYLAESYRDAGEKGAALEWYQKRIDRGGWSEEVYWSMLQIGHMCRDIGLPASMAIDSYLRAFNYRPHRAEALYYLAETYAQQKDYSKAYEYLKLWNYIPKPNQRDSLFNMDWIEEYGLMFQQSIAAYYVGNYQESVDLCNKLLTMESLPESWRHQTEKNRSFPIEKLAEYVTNK